MNTINVNRNKAQKLHTMGQQCSRDGDDAAALDLYAQAIALDPEKSESYYNMGLIHKYRSEWDLSLKYNAIANQLDPEDQAARWNLAIAATALRKWDIARSAWAQNGIALDGDAGPIEMNFGITPVRINPDGQAEVVWAERIDPVRARIYSIPFADSGFSYGDIVLHDGAPVGTRESNGREYAVFNVLELFEASRYSTAVANVELTAEEDLQALEQLLSNSAHVLEDWTVNVRTICKQCSEGRPHEHHDETPSTAWKPERQIGIAVCGDQNLLDLFHQWESTTGAKLVSLDIDGEEVQQRL